jgi:outer membrane receptor for ferrienterochelin and colicin
MTDSASFYKYAYSSYINGKIQADWTINDRLSTVWGISYESVKSFPKTLNLSSPFNTGSDLKVDMTGFIDSNGYTFGILGFKESVFGERNYNNLGMFSLAEFKFSDKFKLDAGIRYDHNSDYGESINPRFGFIMNPTDRLTIKLLYGTAYIQPSNFYKYENFASPTVLHIPNQNLEPEKLQNYSADITYGLGDNSAIHASLFLNKMEDIIRPVAAPAQKDNYPYYNPIRKTGTGAGYVEYNGNQGNVESRGGEISFNHKIDKFSTSLSYSYVTGEDNDFDISQISEHKITLNSSYTGEKFVSGLTLRYYSSVSTDRNNYKYGSALKGGDETYSFDGALIVYLVVV